MTLTSFASLKRITSLRLAALLLAPAAAIGAEAGSGTRSAEGHSGSSTQYKWLFQGAWDTAAWRKALANTLSDPRCRYACIFNWESIRSSEAVLTSITQLVEPGKRHDAESSFSPREVPGCAWWIKADAGVLTNASGGVTNWLDQSGQGRDMDQSSGQAPILALGPNHQPVVRFDGLGSLSSSRDLNSNHLAAHSLFLMARWTDTNAAHCQRILSSRTWNWCFGYMEGHDQSWYANGYVYHGEWSLYGAGAANTNWHLHAGTLTTGTNPVASFWKDDTLLMEAQARPSILPHTMQPRQIQLSGMGSGQRSRCEIAEAILYDRVLTEAELQRVWKYF